MPKPIRGYVSQRFILELDKVSYAKTKQKVEKKSVLLDLVQPRF